jgi:hypothetical protein
MDYDRQKMKKMTGRIPDFHSPHFPVSFRLLQSRFPSLLGDGQIAGLFSGAFFNFGYDRVPCTETWEAQEERRL